MTTPALVQTMNRAARGTWFVTLLLGVALLAFDRLWGANHESLLPNQPWTLLALAGVVTPPIWWALMARKATYGILQGGAAGALCAIAVLWVPTWSRFALMAAEKPIAGGLAGGLDIVFLVFAIGVRWEIVVAIGVAVGSLAAALQQRGLFRPE